MASFQIKTKQILSGISMTLNTFHNGEGFNLSSWEETHISYLYLPSVPTEFLAASPFQIYTIHQYTYYTSNQGIYFYSKEGMQWVYDWSIHWSYIEYQHQRWLGWNNNQMAHWIPAICYLRDNTEKLRHYLIKYGKCLKPATNTDTSPPKPGWNESGNQEVEIMPLKDFFIPALSFLDSVTLKYLFLKRKRFPQGNTIIRPLN